MARTLGLHVDRSGRYHLESEIRMNTHHISDATCPLCEEKLVEAHPYLVIWFHNKKLQYPNLHVAWSFRNQADQNQMVVAGKSKLPWPKSKHNSLDAKGIPQSQALDLFQIDEDGNARWSKPFFQQLDTENQSDKIMLFWGGKWPTLGDNDHFEMVPPSYDS